MNHFVSVIVPNYNHGQYLEQRLCSVFNQTYQDFEVIILDDCSTDNSIEIINLWKKDPHLSKIIINDFNSGSPFAQWERGIQSAKGDLIWIAESDDFCELGFLQAIVESFNYDEEIVVSFSSYILFDNYGYLSKSKVGSVQLFNGISFIKGWMSYENPILNASGAVFKRFAYDRISKQYLSFKTAGDYQFWIEIASQGKVVYLRNNLTHFRLTPASVTSRNKVVYIGLEEDLRICNGLISQYNLSFLQRQAMNAQYTQKYYKCLNLNKTEVPVYLIESMNSLWHSNNRVKALDKFYLWLISSIRRHFRVLI